MKQDGSTEDIAGPIIAQCRREIDAGWQHVDAARAVLRNSEWLLARWRDNRVILNEAVSPTPDMFIPIDPAVVNALRRKRSGRNWLDGVLRKPGRHSGRRDSGDPESGQGKPDHRMHLDSGFALSRAPE